MSVRKSFSLSSRKWNSLTVIESIAHIFTESFECLESLCSSHLEFLPSFLWLQLLLSQLRHETSMMRMYNVSILIYIERAEENIARSLGRINMKYRCEMREVCARWPSSKNITDPAQPVCVVMCVYKFVYPVSLFACGCPCEFTVCLGCQCIYVLASCSLSLSSVSEVTLSVKLNPLVSPHPPAHLAEKWESKWKLSIHLTIPHLSLLSSSSFPLFFSLPLFRFFVCK